MGRHCNHVDAMSELQKLSSVCRYGFQGTFVLSRSLLQDPGIHRGGMPRIAAGPSPALGGKSTGRHFAH
jgi:hypothetical protein